MAFQTRGCDGFAEMVNTSMDNAMYFYNQLCNDPDFIAPVRPQLSKVVFARKDGDDANKRIRKTLLAQGTVIGQTVMNDKVMLKFTLLNPNITHDDIDKIIARIKAI